MATDGAANRHNSVAYTAQQERRIAAVRSMPGPASEVFSGRSGRRVNGAGLGVTVDSTGAGTYSVTAGAGTIYDSTYATQGGWDFEIDTALSAVALPARPGAGTSRIDLIVARIYDVDISVGAVREVKIERVGGTAAASPTTPALPALSLRLATLTVPNSGTISVSANTAVTVAAGGILPVATTTERDALVSAGVAYKGLVVDNAQTGLLERYNGIAYKSLTEGIVRAASGTGTTVANGVIDIPITWPTSFPSTPIVTVSLEEDFVDTIRCTIKEGTRSTTGVTVRVFSPAAVTAVTVHAIGFVP